MKLLPQWNFSIDTYNTRAPDMWALISRNVDFEGKSVLDLGCGYGDMLILSYLAGAEKVLGIDKDSRVVSRVKERIDNKFNDHNISLSIENIEGMNWKSWDIVICFSVLPYLQDPDDLLYKMMLYGKISLIEAQYAGDGPGFGDIRSDKDMREWLKEVGWERVRNIGYTDVEIRSAKRTIWRCTNADD